MPRAAHDGNQRPRPPSWRALVLAAILAVLTGLAVQQVALVYNAGEIESSVPPVPAVMCLLVLAALNPLLRLIGPRWRLSRGELLTIYAVLVLTVAMSGRRMVRILLGFITCPRYYENLADVGAELAPWFAPDDEKAIVQFFESSRDGAIPWEAWLGPLAVWTAFVVVTWIGMFCLLDLFRRRWADQEHLRFPLLYLPLELSVDTRESRRAFLRNKFMWVGFAIGFWYALPVVVSPIWPNFPDWKVTFHPFQALTATPWNELRRIYMRPLPHLIGFGYLMSTDNLFTIWASYLLQQLSWVGLVSFGYRRPGWHVGVEHQQAMGAILALAGWLLWANRRGLLEAATGASRADRARVVGAIAGFAGAVWFIHLLGAFWWLGLALMVMLFSGALVYARIRAETGLPSYWALPFLFQERDFILDVTGTRTFAGPRGFHALAGFNVLSWMTTGQFPQTGAYHVENVRLAQAAGIGGGHMFFVNVAAIIAGLAIAYWTHLGTFYQMGALSAVGAGGDGYYEVRWARGDYAKMMALAGSQSGFQLAPNLFRLAGAGMVLLLARMRAQYGGFPFTPWGYLVACSYGGTYWFSFLMTWAAQKVILRYWGARSHTRAIPFFLGISFGYMAATVAAVIVGFATGKAFSFAAGKRLYFDI